MKKFICLLLTLVCIEATAQTYEFKSVTNATTTDTVVNATTKNLQIARVNGGPIATVQVRAVKISGTPGGVIRMLGSLDGINFVRVNPTDSLIVTNVASQDKVFDLSPTKYTYYRVQYIGVTGPMSETIKARIYIRK